MVLRLLSMFAPGTVRGSVDDYRIRVIWPPMLPKDDVSEVQNQVRLVEAGIRSHRTAMDALGEESPEEELVRVNEDRAALAPQAAESEQDGGGDGSQV